MQVDMILRYPDSWLVAGNPHAREAEQATLEWLRRCGVVDSEEKERDFLEMGVADYAGRPFPKADRDTLEILMKILTLWLLYDDDIEGLSESQPGLLLDSVCGVRRASGQEAPIHKAWLELGEKCRERMSDAWMTRHRKRFSAWLDSIKNEAKMVSRFRDSNEPPTLSAYLGVRMTTIGVIPTLDYLELEVGQELPESFLASRTCRDMELATTLLVILQNDITGLNKDKRNRWVNGALSAAGQDGDEYEGLQVLEQLHRANVSLLARRCDELKNHESPAVRKWVEHICLMVGGWSKWHLEAVRYDSELKLDGGRRVRVQSDPAELGTLIHPEDAEMMRELGAVQ